MERDARTARGARPVVLTSVRTGDGIQSVAEWVSRRVAEWATAPARQPPGARVRSDDTRGLHGTARISAVADSGATVLPVLHGDGPFDPRRVAPRDGRVRVCIVGVMSGPHNGDRLRIEVAVGQVPTCGSPPPPPPSPGPAPRQHPRPWN